MKYQTEIEIDLPVERVVELFDNSDNMAKWQPGLQSFKHLSGEPGKPGAKMELNYKMGKREIQMVETVVQNELPKVFEVTYEAKNVFNKLQCQFISLSPTQTKWVEHNEFKFSGFMMLLGLLMPGAFKKQTMQYMQQFKAFAENEASEHKN